MGEPQALAWGTSPEIADVLLSVLSHPAAGWRARASAPAVCQTWRRTLAQGAAHERMLCQRLRDECKVYVPEERECPHHDGWGAFFRQIWPLRHMWSPEPEASSDAPSEEVRFNISVAVRFRPASRSRGSGDGAEKVTLPLHQRIQLIRLKHGCSRHEAMRRIAAESHTGGAGDALPGISPLDAPTVVYNRLYSGVQDEAPTPPAGLYEEMEAQRKARVLRKPWLEGRRDTGVYTRDPKVALQMGVRLVDGTGGELELSRPAATLPAGCGAGRAPCAAGGGQSGMTAGGAGGGGSGAGAEGPASAHQHQPVATQVGGIPGFIQSDFSTKAAYDDWIRAGGTAEGDRGGGGHSVGGHNLGGGCGGAAPVLSPSAGDGAPAPTTASARAQDTSARLDGNAVALSSGSSAAPPAAPPLKSAPRSSQAKLPISGGRSGVAIAPSSRAAFAEVPGGAAGSGGTEAAGGATARIMSLDPGCREVVVMAPSVGVRAFNFSSVFAEDATQSEVYASCAHLAVCDLLNGVHGCLLVYGQTGAGKTHTVFGDQAVHAGARACGPGGTRGAAPAAGVVPRAVAEVLEAMREREESLGIEAELSLAYVEIFGSEVSDLLRNGQNVGLAAADGNRVDFLHGHRHVLDGRADVKVDSPQQASRLLAAAERCKRKAATAMNERSSRAHSIVMLSLVQRANGIEKRSRLFLADLGGSEKLSRSKAADGFRSKVVMVGGEEHSRITWDEYYAGRAKLQESLNINSGLYALQRCIDALIAREQAAGTRAVHVPFSDSKLTMLLHGALGGGARTTVLICASLEPSDAVEAISSLRFGEACSRVESRAARRGDAAAIARLVQGVDGEIAACQALIERDQRWEQRVTIREDRVRMKDNFSTQVTVEGVEDLSAGVMVVAPDDGTEAQEVVTHEVVANVLVGAEEHEARLADLLQRRRELLGEE